MAIRHPETGALFNRKQTRAFEALKKKHGIEESPHDLYMTALREGDAVGVLKNWRHIHGETPITVYTKDRDTTYTMAPEEALKLFKRGVFTTLSFWPSFILGEVN